MNLDEFGNLAFFKDLASSDLQLLAPFFSPQSFSAGKTVFEQGSRADYLYLVVRGEVVIRYKPDDGPVMDVTRVYSGGVFGWSAAMQNPYYTSAAICSTNTETLRIRGGDLQGLCERRPPLGKVILNRLTAVIAERKCTSQVDLISMLQNNYRHPVDKGEEDMKPDPKVELQMKALVEQLSAYIETFHGGSVEYVSFDGRLLKVRLGGACLGCPLSPATLHGWVEGTVKQFFPDLEGVEPV